MKQLTERERELLVVAAAYAKDWHNSNPDVGMGPSDWTIVGRVLQKLTFSVSAAEQQRVAELLEARGR